MLNRIFLLAALFLPAIPGLAAEEITFNYVYAEDHRVNFSNIRRGPIKLAEFTDSRDAASPNLIAEGYIADKPLAIIVRDALIQGFQKGNATLVDTGENVWLEGKIVSSVVELVSVNGQDSIQLTVRTEVKLMGSGRTLYQTVLFGRGAAPLNEGITPALNEALNRSIRGLVQDDYFLNELL
ncbi:MAG: hypothetical protein WD772_11885 [Pseudohongiellaceae bacterium]